jgi:hypothetical protein
MPPSSRKLESCQLADKLHFDSLADQNVGTVQSEGRPVPMTVNTNAKRVAAMPLMFSVES